MIERSVYVRAKVELFVFCSAITSGSMVMCERYKWRRAACLQATVGGAAMSRDAIQQCEQKGHFNITKPIKT